MYLLKSGKIATIQKVTEKMIKYTVVYDNGEISSEFKLGFKSFKNRIVSEIGKEE
jgi:hypothetical protein